MFAEQVYRIHTCIHKLHPPPPTYTAIDHTPTTVGRAHEHAHSHSNQHLLQLQVATCINPSIEIATTIPAICTIQQPTILIKPQGALLGVRTYISTTHTFIIINFLIALSNELKSSSHNLLPAHLYANKNLIIASETFHKRQPTTTIGWTLHSL